MEAWKAGSVDSVFELGLDVRQVGQGEGRDDHRIDGSAASLVLVGEHDGVADELLAHRGGRGILRGVERADEHLARRLVMIDVDRLTQPLDLGCLGELFSHSLGVVVSLAQRAVLQVGKQVERQRLGGELVRRPPGEIGDLETVSCPGSWRCS